MKSAIICFNCDKLTRFSDSYAIKITIFSREYVKNVSQNLAESIRYAGTGDEKVKVRVCRKCTKKAGYKVKQKKKIIRKREELNF